ncbi:MAG: lytic transglycosylase domain-containing protein [Bacteroidetes bacterium]|nr:lytic transglycosylase domain-containing protein [Bacteroidota bacterium]
MKIKYFSYGLLLGVVPLALLFFLFNRNGNVSGAGASVLVDTIGSHTISVTAVTPPTNVVLFGKQLPLLEDWEVRERFEREFYYNLVNSDQLILWWKRLGRWESMIDSSLDANGLDRDLKYLMVAESGVRNVESPAKAHGFWQMIPPTAQRWGLRVDDDIDERLDPYKSTGAAIRYLATLKAQFNDYLLACAAYNMSEDNVAEVLRYQHQTNYWNLYINEETMRYVFRIAAIKELLEHGDRYGLKFGHVPRYSLHNVKSISVNGPIESIADWAVGLGYSYKDVKIYNPWLVSRRIPSGTFTITVPADDTSRTTVR